MASSSQMQNLNSESASDDYIGDNDSLDITLEDELAGLARSCAETPNHAQPSVGSPGIDQEEMDYPDEDEEGLGDEFTVHNLMTK
ncbi:hypothetical protein L2E82_15343 [Cichorium intybus]|uniref:Uncharacterized protein n=1 Tax=Cichorium intybus TaxID=13427 RepID=A0ACB9F343_CICIN|nr:hypothetical protein L2E82_15343 [Cichorium intybus]